MNEQFDTYFRLVELLREKEQAAPADRKSIRDQIEGVARYLVANFSTLEILLDAAFAYYVSGFYARSYNVIDPSKISALQLPQRLLALFLHKDFEKISLEISRVAKDDDFSDAGIAQRLDSGELVSQLPLSETVETAITNLVLTRVLAECYEQLLIFVSTGYEQQIDNLKAKLLQCQTLTIKLRDSQWWWWLVCTQFVIDEFVENSLWTILKPMRKESPLVDSYIISNYRRIHPVVEFWRSQIESLPAVMDAERKSFVLKMPTGAGKTRVAELMILRFLLDYPDNEEFKCVYIAPFRTLASEVEESLSQSFKALVSAFYGGYETDPLDLADTVTARIFVVTPEKLDGLLRQRPELISQIRLVILDEGHLIGEKHPRGQRYQLLIQRLVYLLKIRKDKSERQGARLLFISGVLPNVSDFADWLTGNKENNVISTWRPIDEPTFGDLIWDGEQVSRFDFEWDGQKIKRGSRKQISLNNIPITATSIDMKNLGLTDRELARRRFIQTAAQIAIQFSMTDATLVFLQTKEKLSKTFCLNSSPK